MEAKKTMSMRLEIPVDIHRKLKKLKDERMYSGMPGTLAQVSAALIHLGLDTIDERAKTFPQIPAEFEPAKTA